MDPIEYRREYFAAISKAVRQGKSGLVEQVRDKPDG